MPQLVVCEEATLNVTPMTDDEFFEFCGQNPEYRIERTAEGRIIVMSGTGGKTGNRNALLTWELSGWALKDKHGVAFDSSTLFRLPNGAMRSPDASWVPRSRLTALTPSQKERFLPLCPDFVIELTSPSDRLPAAREKMDEWMANGCQLGWVIDVKSRCVYIYRPDGVEVLQSPAEVTAGDPVSGFTLHLQAIWDPGW
jgi:Uma2 family endonuclease